MNYSAITHKNSLPFRQPLARNRISFRLIAAGGDLYSCRLQYWKRSAPESKLTTDMNVRYENNEQSEWIAEVSLAEEAHYIKYDFVLTDRLGKTLYFNDQGFSDVPPTAGHFELLQVNESDIPALPEWSRGCVYYQIFPERFAAGKNPASIRSYSPWETPPTRDNFMGGNLEGIRQKLPYLKDLGVDCFYLTPIFLADFNHKYATIDYFRIDPDFGTQEDLVRLVEEAHRANIRVLLDGVFNHVGIDFIPFIDLRENGASSRYREWFYPKRFPITISADDYECVGDYAYMPRLRVVNPPTRDYILSVLLYWLQVAQIDGWRFDVADELDPRAVRFWRDQVKMKYPNALFLAETWGDAGSLLHGGDQFDSAMNYLFRNVVIDYFARDTIDEIDLDRRIQHLLMKYSNETSHAMYNCLGSHDTARLLTEFRGDKTKLRQAFAFQMMFPGSPAIYYGDELGMEGENDPGCRAGMAWNNGDMDLYGYMKKLIGLRRRSKAIRNGSYHTVLKDGTRRLFAFERRYENERVLVVFNRGDSDQHLDFAGWAEIVDISPQSVEIIIK